jgi:hypothetical protein
VNQRYVAPKTPKEKYLVKFGVPKRANYAVTGRNTNSPHKLQALPIEEDKQASFVSFLFG